MTNHHRFSALAAVPGMTAAFAGEFPEPRQPPLRLTPNSEKQSKAQAKRDRKAARNASTRNGNS